MVLEPAIEVLVISGELDNDLFIVDFECFFHIAALFIFVSVSVVNSLKLLTQSQHSLLILRNSSFKVVVFTLQCLDILLECLDSPICLALELIAVVGFLH